MPTLLTLALEMLGLSLRSILRPILRTAFLSGVALVFLMIGLTSLAVALWIVLARATDPAVAALIMAGAGFVLAALTLLAARAQMRPRAPVLSLRETEAVLSAIMAKAEGGGVWTPILAAALLGFLVTARK